jgi:hypothetical protein
MHPWIHSKVLHCHLKATQFTGQFSLTIRSIGHMDGPDPSEKYETDKLTLTIRLPSGLWQRRKI